jgi:hypothetical protein
MERPPGVRGCCLNTSDASLSSHLLPGILDGDPKAKLQHFDDGLAGDARRMAIRRQHDSNDDEREYDEGKYEQLKCDKLRLLI